MFRRVQRVLNRTLGLFGRVRGDGENVRLTASAPAATEEQAATDEPSTLEQSLTVEESVPERPTRQPIIVRLERPYHEVDDGFGTGQPIFFHDEPALYGLLLRWNPATAPPRTVVLMQECLVTEHVLGVNQTPIRIFYRIFLNRQLSANRADRPRFLTGVRRGRIAKRRKERQGLSVYV